MCVSVGLRVGVGVRVGVRVRVDYGQWGTELKSTKDQRLDPGKVIVTNNDKIISLVISRAGTSPNVLGFEPRRVLGFGIVSSSGL